MPKAPETFEIVLTADELKSAREKADALGVDLSADAGTLPVKSGVQLRYAVQAQADGSFVVTFAVLKKPWIASLGMIGSYVKNLIGV